MNGYQYQKDAIKDNRITKQDILNYLYQCVPVELQNQKCVFYDKSNEISIGRHLFNFYIRNQRIIITEKKVRNGEVFDVLLTPRKNKLNKRKLGTKKGFVNQHKTILIYSVALFLSASGINFVMNNLKSEISQETSESIEVLESFDEKVEPLLTNIVIQDDSMINLQVNVVPIDRLGFQKRELLVQKYGNQINFFANRYGLDFDFVVNLLSQESHNELDSVSAEEKENLGQLTSSICTEPIMAPVFQDGVLVGYEGYFILPALYPENLSVSTIFDVDETYLTDIQRDNLRRAKSKNCNWTVFRKNEAFCEANSNIKVSVAYLSYLINKKQDLILGAMSYHAGYSKTNELTREDAVMGRVDAFDKNYIANIIRYQPIETYDNGFDFTIHFQNGEIKTYNIKNPTLESEYNYEKENGYHL